MSRLRLLQVNCACELCSLLLRASVVCEGPCKSRMGRIPPLVMAKGYDYKALVLLISW